MSTLFVGLGRVGAPVAGRHAVEHETVVLDVAKARTGELTVMAGGSADDVERARPHRRLLDRDMPFVSVTDLPAVYEGLARVRELRDTGAVDHVVSGHTAGLLDRLDPVSDDLTGVAGVIGRRL